MMKLYYSPGACSLSPHIVLREAGIKFDLDRVNLASHKTASGADFMKINPKGYVPALQLDNDQVLTEGVAIVQFIADSHPEAHLAPKPGTLERARLQEHLNFISTELHKAFGPYFSSGSSDNAKQSAAERIKNRLGHFEEIFADGRHYLFGENFCVADAYLFVIASWTKPIAGFGLETWPKLSAFVARVAGRQTVQDAMRAEGLIPSG